jgi:hypothetical protein
MNALDAPAAEQSPSSSVPGSEIPRAEGCTDMLLPSPTMLLAFGATNDPMLGAHTNVRQ